VSATPRPVPVAACRAEVSFPVRPQDLNTFHSVFGGYVMQRVDDLATALVTNVSGRAAVTVRLERMVFRAGITAFQQMRLTAQGVRTFHTSMEVEVRVEGEDPGQGRRWQASDAILTVVGLDEGGRPVSLPPLIPATAAERDAFEAAGARRLARSPAPGPVWPLPTEVSAADADRLSLERTARIVPNACAGALGRAPAGWVLSLADELAAVTASRHACKPTVTAAVDGVSFARPLPVGDIVLMRSTLTAAFRTSMEVRVEVWWRGRYRRTEEHVADCHFTYVALGPDGRPAPVPPFVPQGEREAVLHRLALHRRAARAPGPGVGTGSPAG
jgi:acyl-coenzyme A thioesterase 7